jgi:hypothetical protein
MTDVGWECAAGVGPADPMAAAVNAATATVAKVNVLIGIVIPLLFVQAISLCPLSTLVDP